jgi:diguanylate cyclase (GGDEF)-like protein/PAS domain S-box-containing protein
MSDSPQSSARAASRRGLSRAAAGGVSALGATALMGWTLGEPSLGQLIPGQPVMKANAAIAFLTSGAAIWLVSGRRSPRPARALAVASGAAVAALGFAVLCEHLTGWSFGIDELLFSDPIAGATGSAPGRFAPSTAVGFTMAGLALMLMGGRVGRGWVATGLAFSVTTVGISNAVALASGQPQTAHGVPVLMAPPTARGFLLLGCGIVLCEPGRPLSLLLASREAGGTLVRRVLTAGLAIPAAIGLMRQAGTFDWLERRIGLDLFDVCIVGALALLVVALGWRLERGDSDRRAAQVLLEESESLAQAILDTAQQAFVSIDERGVILEWNRQAETIFGWSRTEALGRRLAETVLPQRYRAAHAAGLERFLQTGEQRAMGTRLELEALRRDGQELPVELTISSLRTASGWRFNAFLQDISERRSYERRLEHMAEHDPLTGVLNRRGFDRELRGHVGRSARYGAEGALLILDIDRFKHVNDTCGHAAGDELIARVARALCETLRGSDVVGRLGGDEFAVLLPKADAFAARRVAANLRARVGGQKLPVGAGRGSLSASVGVAVLAEDADLTAEDLIVKADLAMYEAKAAGGDRCVLCASGYQQPTIGRNERSAARAGAR